ncbi:hypothetical protein [Amycolatopsis aidingensis]|uniref:hypothetical protein n=1 Tax=Amycolatopsis aidingensis TaxID=2842453 RepID=UPI001C0BC5E3|nr:hypothetical protein [Amycolatopsis aidingensis]
MAAFAPPDARVQLLPWPTPTEDCTTPAGPSAPAQPRDADELTAAREAVRALGHDCEIAHLATDHGPPTTATRPFWADLLTDQPRSTPGITLPPSTAPAHSAETAADIAPGDATATAELILTAVPAHPAGDGSLDRVALAAARLLSVGGVLAIYTHSDWYHGRLVDPTGPMVAAGQNADLLYLQHIVALHTPIRDGHLHTASTPTAETAYARARHRANARGLPAPHARTHSDVLVFVQPHGHHTVLPPESGGGEADPGDSTEIR